MNRISARTVSSVALRTTALAGALGLTLSLPAFFLAWEGTTAQAEASLVANAAQDRAETALRGAFTSFDRATASLRADQVTGDSVALTARLLLLEPMAAPSSGLVVVNQRGVPVAATAPAPGEAAQPLWWAAEAASLPAHQVGLLGCGPASNGAGYVLVRRILDDAGHDVGAVAGTVSAAMLRDLAEPANGLVASGLRDSTGCSLLESAAFTTAAPAEPGLVRLYRGLLPPNWGKPTGVAVTARAGNLAWTGTVSPDAALALRSADVEAGAATLQTLILSLAGVQILLAMAPRTRARAPAFVRAPAGAEAPIEAPIEGKADLAADITEPATRYRALVVGLSDPERNRVATHLLASGFDVDTAADGFAAQRLSEQAGPLHRAMDLIVLDATLSGLSADALLSRLKRQMDFERLRVVLVARGKIVGAVGGPPDAAQSLDAVMATLYGSPDPMPAAIEAQTYAPTRLRQALASAATLSHAD